MAARREPLTPRRGAALVTGAAKRIGRAIALELARAGFDVAVHHNRSAAEARALVAEIEAMGGRAVALMADLSAEEETVSLAQEAAACLGPLNCLVNNASVFERDEVGDATRAGWDLHMAVNLRAPFVLSQALAAGLPRDGRGDIVNIVDQRVWNLTPHFTSYTVSKAGLWTLTRTLALALAPRIRVNAIGPGPTLPSARQDQGQFLEQWRATPLSRPTAPEEIAAGVRFVLDAPAMTGQMIALDAGQHLGWSYPKGGRDLDE